MTHFEQLQLLVGTDRIINLLQDIAKDAIDAGDWLKVRQITDLVVEITGNPVIRLEKKEPEAESPQTPLTSLNISTRCIELLKKAGLISVSDLQRYSLEGLLEINGIGEVAAKQIENALQAQGITLRSVELRSRWQNENSPLVIDGLATPEGELSPLSLSAGKSLEE